MAGFARWFRTRCACWIAAALVPLTTVDVLRGQTIYPVRVSPEAPPGRTVLRYKVTPDGDRVLYLADHDRGGVFDLYSISLGQHSAVRLNDPLANGGSFYSQSIAEITPDGGTALYVAEQLTAGRYDLFSVPVDRGRSPVRLNGVGAPTGNALFPAITPDGSGVVYRSGPQGTTPADLYHVAVSGGLSVRLTPAMPAGRTMKQFEITPDGSRVVYLADFEVEGRYELYSVRLDGVGGAVKLSPDGSGVMNVQRFELAAAGGLVVYRGKALRESRTGLFAVPASGGDSTDLSSQLAVDGYVETGFDVSPDGKWVAYKAEVFAGDEQQFFSVRTSGGIPRAFGSKTWFESLWYSKFSPDSRMIVFIGREIGEPNNLYAVPVGGASAKPVPISTNFGTNSALDGFWIHPNGGSVYYIADQDEPGVRQLYRVTFAGGLSVKVGPTVPGSVQVTDPQFSADGHRCVFSVLVSSGFNRVVSYSEETGTTVVFPILDSEGGGQATLAPDGKRIYILGEFDGVSGYELLAWRPQALWGGGGGNWSSADGWEGGLVPGDTVEVIVRKSGVVQVGGAGGNPGRAEALWIGNGSQPAVVEFADGGVLDVREGVQVGDRGVLRGDGLVVVGGDLDVSVTGALGVGAGEMLEVFSGDVEHAGRTDVMGVAGAPAGVRFSGAVNNLAGTGAVLAHDAVLRFDGGLTNAGTLALAGGFNDVFGAIQNEGGRVVISGGSIGVFYGDVINSGEIQVSAAGGVASSAVFFGALSGAGTTGGGVVFLEGDARPGASPGVMAFGGDVVSGPAAVMAIEIAGTEAGVGYDRIDVAGHLYLGGVLRVRLIDGFVPEAGAMFDVWDAGSASGGFAATELGQLPEGLFWHAGAAATTGVLRVGLTPEEFGAFAAYYGLGDVSSVSDGDLDGTSDVFEFVGGSDPVANDGGGLVPTVVSEAGVDTVVFEIAEPLGAGVELAVEMSEAMAGEAGEPGGWSVAAERLPDGEWTGLVPVIRSAAGAGRERIEVPIDSAEAGSRFYRLRAVLSP